MEYENQNFIPEDQNTSQPETHAEQYAYRGQGRGQKESPFADSPYEMNHEPRYSGQYEKPRKPKKKKKNGFWKKAAAIVAVLALVAGSCGITAAVVNDYWQDWAEDYASGVSQKMLAMQEQIDALSAKNTGNSVSGTVVANGSGLTPSQVYAQNVRSVVLISSQVTGSMYGQTTKRQLTWFRREKDVIWVNKNEYNYDETRILNDMYTKIEEKGIVRS